MTKAYLSLSSMTSLVILLASMPVSLSAQESAPVFSTLQTSDYNKVAEFNGATGLLKSCVRLLDGGVQLNGTNGEPEAYLIDLSIMDLGEGKIGFQVVDAPSFDTTSAEACQGSFDNSTSEANIQVRINNTADLDGLYNIKLKHNPQLPGLSLDLLSYEKLEDNVSNPLYLTSKVYNEVTIESVVFGAEQVTASNAKGSITLEKVQALSDGSDLWRAKVAYDKLEESSGSKYLTIEASSTTGNSTKESDMEYWFPKCISGNMCGNQFDKQSISVDLTLLFEIEPENLQIGDKAYVDVIDTQSGKVLEQVLLPWNGAKFVSDGIYRTTKGEFELRSFFERNTEAGARESITLGTVNLTVE